MKSGFIIFFSIVLVVHTAINYYIFVRGWQALPVESSFRPCYIAIAILLWASYIVGQILESKAPSIISDTLVWIGAFWFAFMVYFFFTIILIDLVRLFDSWFTILPSAWRENYAATKLYTFLAVITFYTILIFLGHLNARNPRIKEMTFHINKPNAEYE